VNNKLDVICIGAALVDIPLHPVSKNIFDSESYPLEKICMTIGGDAINEATIISRLGYKVALMSRIGKDAVGDYIIKFCEQNNIDSYSVNIDPDIDTSINVGLVTEDGERTFVTNRNGSLWKTNIDDVDFKRFKEAKILSLASIFNNPLIDGESLVKIFTEAKKNNMLICADMIKRRFGKGFEDIREALGYVDYFFPNYDEACLITGKTDLDEMADAFLGCGVKNVIIKTGKDGCFVKNSKETLRVPIYKYSKLIDTIGAGDNFAAGFITAILDGRSLKECAEFANVTASISVEYLGATTGVKNKQQVAERMKEYIISKMEN